MLLMPVFNPGFAACQEATSVDRAIRGGFVQMDRAARIVPSLDHLGCVRGIAPNRERHESAVTRRDCRAHPVDELPIALVQQSELVNDRFVEPAGVPCRLVSGQDIHGPGLRFNAPGRR